MSNSSHLAQRLLDRLDAIVTAVSQRDDAVALIGLGSVGVHTDRLDDHSDLDFFLIVDDGAVPRYLDSIDWLESAHPVGWSFPNSRAGRKALFEDGLFAEYAVFTVEELRRSSYSPGRIVWQRSDAPEHLETPLHRPSVAAPDSIDHQVDEALTNLYVGLHRDARGERLSALRFIQVYALDRLITIVDLMSEVDAPAQDVFDPARGVERRINASGLPLSLMSPGYEHNRAAAEVILQWLADRFELPSLLAAAIRAALIAPTAG